MNTLAADDNAGMQHLETVRQYFIRGDAGRPDTLELFTDDVQIYFPKFGVAHGKAALMELAQGLIASMQEFSHDLSSFRYVVTPEVVVVEGTTRGMDRANRRWTGGATPGGRFCSVFQFRGPLISRMFIYLDPDYSSCDADRFLWGRNRTW